MRKRAAILAVALVAVGIATALISNPPGCDSEKEDACPGDWANLQKVLVANRNIQAGESTDSLVDDGAIVVFEVPQGALLDGAATDVEQIEGRTVAEPIGKHEQISVGSLG